MSNISYIGPNGRGEIVLPGEPLESAVEILKDLLIDAKSGKLCAIAVVSILEEGTHVEQREFAFKNGRFADMYVALDVLMHRLREYKIEGQ